MHDHSTRRTPKHPLLLLLQAAAEAQAAPVRATHPKPVFQQDLPNLELDDRQVTVREIREAPGQKGQAHRHPGFVLVYVLKGRWWRRFPGGPEKTTRAGEMFYEYPGARMKFRAMRARPSRRRFLAFVFRKKGVPLTTPV